LHAFAAWRESHQSAGLRIGVAALALEAQH
jgi:hypothetical protein